MLSYLLKNVSVEELVTAIRDAIAGQPSLSPEAVQVLIHGVQEPPTADYTLTNREREILAYPRPKQLRFVSKMLSILPSKDVLR